MAHRTSRRHHLVCLASVAAGTKKTAHFDFFDLHAHHTTITILTRVHLLNTLLPFWATEFNAYGNMFNLSLKKSLRGKLSGKNASVRGRPQLCTGYSMMHRQSSCARRRRCLNVLSQRRANELSVLVVREQHRVVASRAAFCALKGSVLKATHV